METGREIGREVGRETGREREVGTETGREIDQKVSQTVVVRLENDTAHCKERLGVGVTFFKLNLVSELLTQMKCR